MSLFISKSVLYRLLLTLLFIIPISAEESSGMVGTKAAAFSLFKISDDKYYRTKNIIGKKNIIISFFGTWCKPCRKEIPKLQQISNELSEDDYLRRFIIHKIMCNFKINRSEVENQFNIVFTGVLSKNHNYKVSFDHKNTC